MIADQRHGIAVATLANINRDQKKRPEPYKAADFIYWDPSHRNPKEEAVDPEVASQTILQRFFPSLLKRKG